MSEIDLLKEELQACQNRLDTIQKNLHKNESMASLGSLVAGFTHDLSTPIGLGVTGMSSFVEQTQKIKRLYDKQEMQEEDFKKYLDKSTKIANLVFSNLRSASELMSSFKRISIDQTSELKHTLNLHNYFNDVVATLHNRLKHTNIVIKNSIDKEITLNSYAGAYSQIFTNLILNSLIHAFDKDDSGLITVFATSHDSTISLEYADNGKGMSKENLSKIFDAFFTTKIDDGGSGLGANIIYELVTKKLMGKISVESQEGEGIHFSIELPLNINE